MKLENVSKAYYSVQMEVVGMKKSRLKEIGCVLIVLSGVIFYLFYCNGIYAIDSRYKNKAVRDLTIYETEDPLNRKIDFEKLKASNKDIVAWVYIPGTTIDYPILIGSEDESYIRKDIHQGYNPLGSIFTYADMKKDLSDGCVMLFGHNIRKNQMFGELVKYTESTEYVKKNQKFYVYLGNKAMEFDIISIFICDEYDDLFTVGRELGTADYADFVTSLLQRNKFSDYVLENSKINTTDNQVFSLVTCYGDSRNTSERLVVNGSVVRERYIVNKEFNR